MELFTVNRYSEDNKTKAKRGDDAANEDEILQKLLQKAEKRKRKHKTVETAAVEADEPANNVDTEHTVLEAVAPEEQQPDDDAAITATSKDFEVLGADGAAAKRAKVEMVLPAWLAQPTIIAGDSLNREEGADADTDEAALKQQLYLAKYTRRALKQMKIKRLFPVQRAVIPWILEAHAKPAPYRPRDICVSAPTGSGKTLAFAIPLVQLLANRVQCKVRALVVLPVAELALQVYKVFSALCSKTELEVCLLSKQHRLEDEQEKLVEQYKGAYYSKVDIVVTTPGRLVDHLHATKGFCLKALQFLVIDEADRIMDAVFQNWLYHLDDHVRETTDQLLAGRSAPLCYAELLASYGKQPHKLLFSATLTQDPEKLQNLRLFQPKLFTTVLTDMTALAVDKSLSSAPAEDRSQFIGKYTTPTELKELYCLTEMRLKPLTLFSLIQQHGWKRFLCFTNSADTSSRLAFVLGKLLEGQSTQVAELSASLAPGTRKKTLLNFTRGLTQGLICSDALARGIDVHGVDIVICYDVPRHIKTYIHRVGRTARAGQAGTAITMLTPQEQPQFNKMLGEVGKSVGEEISTSADIEVQHADIYKSALGDLRKHVEVNKTLKVVQKRRNAQQANLHKDPSQMTLMEKLQMKAGAQVTKRADPKVLPVAKPAKTPLKPPERKIKPNARKRKAIEE